ncbi:MAG: efflux RND transporter periplasmic adaptor subunit, partial [Geobacteraceae bacterium]|nr:efflux RND transporter periplasmic adaptor subunit [Geobacteraceae bacterium]
TSLPNVVVVPAPAVQTGQSGQFVFVVKTDRTVAVRPVVTGETYQGEVVVVKGLGPGETVVTDGQMQLVPGAKVEIKSAKPAPQVPRP